MKIAAQGFPYIGALLAIAVVLALFEATRPLGAVFALLGAFVAFFFRDPTRVPPSDPALLVSPGDGKVVYAGPVDDDPSLKQISIFLSVFDVHINRSPLSAIVDKIAYTPGRFLAAYKKEASVRNERNEIVLADGDFTVTVRQIAGVVARRIVCSIHEKDRLERGERIGLIQFGSRMEVVMPAETELLVRMGDRVRGGQTAIGRRA